MELLTGDFGIVAMLGAGIVSAAVAIALDFSPELRRRANTVAETQRLP